MEENNNKIINRNASASVFGLEFQVNAAILLMIENIKNAISIKIEGKYEDIELKLNNQKTIYAQAKSVVKLDDYTNVIKNLKKSLETLNDTCSKVNNVEKLIYITNTSNPFNDIETMVYFIGYTKLSYEELPDKAKIKIDKIINKKEFYNIDKSLLNIYVLPFYGNNKENRYKIIKNKVRDFIEELDIWNIRIDLLLSIWQNEYFKNATLKNSELTVTKEDFAWAIIVLGMGDYIEEENVDEAILIEINNKYRNLINHYENKFELITKILFDYNEFEGSNISKEKLESFINNKFKDYYFEIFHNDNSIDKEIKEQIIKSIIRQILSKRILIDKVRKGVSLN
ncbi:hypothetical protein [Brachyspira hampsonii]|uniref:hypothetical protein n=1 Tax=Brachyspira hampsonii TaxID=1287055 RepID=UPI001CA52216|nr:hypothetical protein [Brachyspira hampsonii]MBW5390560.1 hypothetical protein [Brachyspira hampsonii]